MPGCLAGVSVGASAAPSLSPGRDYESPYSAPPPAGPPWTSGLDGKRKYSWREHLRGGGCRGGETLTSPQGPDALLQPVGLARLVLAWVLVDYCQVLVPVAPVHLVHPEENNWSQVRGGGGGGGGG